MTPRRVEGASAVALAFGVSLVLGACSSVYQKSYEEETARLEEQQRAEQAQERAAHAEAQRYAAVVYFATGSAQITQDGYGELDWFVGQMQPYPQAVLEVNGFADSTGSEAKNQQLSSERANAVASYLASRGIPPSQIVTQAFSTQFPAASNTSAKGRRNNRRVEVTVR